MPEKRFTRRDWIAGATATMTAAGLHACGPSSREPRGPTERKSPFASLPRPDRPNIIVFLADTLRADHLSCYGNPTKTSPFLDSLAQRGIQFDQMISSSTWTKPSLGTMLTGVPARVHQAVQSSAYDSVANFSNYRVQALRSSFETLPQSLKRVGYSTAYLQSNAHGRPEFGYGRGFDFVRYLPHYPAYVQVADALDWITREVHQPFFLFIHEIDPHGPYAPRSDTFYNLHGVKPNDVLAILEPAEAKRVKRYVELLELDADFVNGPQAFSPEATNYIKMNYDGEIFEVDEQIERLIANLEKLGVMDDTIFAFTSDHGEGFGDHQFYGHAAIRAYDELLHVPLIVAGGGLPGGERIAHSTTMIDFHPTLLELADAPVPSYVPGSPMISNDREVLVSGDRLAYADLTRGLDASNWDAAVVKGRYKIASHRPDKAYWIFDREADPDELENLAGTGKLDPALEQDLVVSLQSEVARYARLSQEFGEPEWMEADDSVEEELEALGYV